MEEENETSILKKNSKIAGKAFEKEELIDYSSDILKIECQILESGIKEIKFLK